MIDFFEPHIAAELENNAAEFSSVQVRFSNECRSEVCLDTNAHMAYEFTVSGGDVVDLIDSSRSVSLYFKPYRDDSYRHRLWAMSSCQKFKKIAE